MRGRTWSYYITYRYRVEMPGIGQKFYQREQMVSADTYRWKHKGASVEILYLPSNPAIAKLAGKDADNTAWWNARFTACLLMILALPLSALYPVFLYGERAYYELGDSFQLRKAGKVAEAEVASRFTGQDNRYFITYRFRLNTPGAWCEGKQQVCRQTYDWMQPSLKVPISYLPANPAISRLIGDYADNVALKRILIPLLFWFSVLDIILLGFLGILRVNAR